MNIPKPVNFIMDILTGSGYQAYLVGGCVRDFLMGQEPKDFDVATDATPDEVHEIFDTGTETTLIDTGIKQGTVTIIKDHIPVEVTTFRRESRYSDGRHPDQVEFTTSLEEDLARRDFTINALAYNESQGIVDLYDGQVDIKNKTISCVGTPQDRFGEDALRIMRALRFASVLDFEIEENTKAAILSQKDSLNLISKERIQKELEGLLCGRAAARVMRDYAAVIAVIIPEIVPMIGLDQCTPYHIYDVWEHTLRVIENSPPDPVSRLAALFHDIGKPSCFSLGEDGVGHFYGHPEVSYEMCSKIMRNLKFDNATRNDVEILVRWHDLRPEPTDKAVRKTLIKVTPRLFDKWIDIKRADNKGQSPHISDRQQTISEIEEIGHRLIEEEGALSTRTINITGRDILDLGVAEGPKIGEMLRTLLEEILEEKTPNDRDALIKRAKELLE